MASANDVQLDEKNLARQGTVAIKLSELAKNIDIDGDGNIDEDEKRILDTLKEMDIDGDGNISLKELVNLGKQLNIAEEQKKTYKKLILLVLLFAMAAIAATFLACLGAVEAAKDARPDASGTMLTTSVSGKSKVVQTQAHVDTIKITDLYKATYTTLDGVKNMGFQVGASFYSYTITGFQQDLKGDGTSAVRFYTSRGDSIYITSSASLLELKAGGTVDISAAATLTRHLLSARDLLNDGSIPGPGATVTNGMDEYDSYTIGAMANATVGNFNATPSFPSNMEMKIMQACGSIVGSIPEKNDDNSVECICNDGFKGNLETEFDGLNFTVTGTCTLAAQPVETSCWMENNTIYDKASGFDEEKFFTRVNCECPWGSHSGKVEWDFETQVWTSTCAMKTNIPKKAVGNKPWDIKKWEDDTYDGLKSLSYEFICPPTYDGGSMWWDSSSSQWQRRPCQPAYCERGVRDETTSPATCKCYPNEYGQGAKWQKNTEMPWKSGWIPAVPAVTDLADTCKEKPSCPENSNLNHTTGMCDCHHKFVGGYTFSESTMMWMGSCTAAPCPAFAEQVHHYGYPECKCTPGHTSKAEGLWWNHTTKAWNGVCEPYAPCPIKTVPVGSGDSRDCRCSLGYEGWTEYFHKNNTYANHCKQIVCTSPAIVTNDMKTYPPTSYCDCPSTHYSCMNYTSNTVYCKHQTDTSGCVD